MVSAGFLKELALCAVCCYLEHIGPIIYTGRASRPGGFGTSGTNGDYVRLIRKSTGTIGATKFLKVMAGDKIHASVDYYYTATNTNNSGATPLTNFVNSLISSFGNTNTAGNLIKGEASTITLFPGSKCPVFGMNQGKKLKHKNF